MPKSRVRKKKGKPVKYTPNPTGISKTKLKKLKELLEQYNIQENDSQVPEIREGEGIGTLIIPDELKEKINMASENPDIEDAIELSEKNEENDNKPDGNIDISSEGSDEMEGPSTSES